MRGWSRGAITGYAGRGGCLAVLTLAPLVTPSCAGAAQAPRPGVTARVLPSHGLVEGQAVTVTGRGLGKPPANGAPAWFIAECTASVRGHMNPSRDASHCDITHAALIRVDRNGSFSAHFLVRTGIVGDGYCGVPGNTTCVIGISTAQGQGTVVPITFAVPSASDQPGL